MDIRLKELLLRCFFIRKWSCDSFDISVISKEILIKDNRASCQDFRISAPVRMPYQVFQLR